MFARLRQKLGIKPSYTVPTGLVDRWMQGNPRTPDLHELEQHQHHLYFAYGDEMIGGRAEGIIKAQPVYKEVFTEAHMLMFKASDGQRSYPVGIEDEHVEHLQAGAWCIPAPIKGQLFQVTTAELMALDSHRDNEVKFTRRRVRIDIPYLHVQRSGFKDFYEVIERVYEKRAYIHIGKPDYWFRSEQEYHTYRRFTHSSEKLLKKRLHNQSYVQRYLYSLHDFK